MVLRTQRRPLARERPGPYTRALLGLPALNLPSRTTYHGDMIPYSIRRVLLVLAAAAFMISRAAAQTDADFTSALQKGAPSPAQFAKIKAKRQKPAPAPKAPTADDAVWQKVLETVKRDGAYKPGAGPLPGAFTIDDSTGDPKGTMRFAYPGGRSGPPGAPAPGWTK